MSHKRIMKSKLSTSDEIRIAYRVLVEFEKYADIAKEYNI